MMTTVFDKNAISDGTVSNTVQEFLANVETLEESQGNSTIIHQDGVRDSYYIRCCIQGKVVSELLDLDARLMPESLDSFRANRELLLKHRIYRRMSQDAEAGREFNDIIVEYNTSYHPEQPLKVWGGQHRSKSIQHADSKDISRNHGFRVYFCLTKEQRSELALISNTNINVSNDLFDRQLEETEIGPHLRQWCERVGLLASGEDFPDAGSRSDRITTQGARTFVVNFFKGQTKGQSLTAGELDKNIYGLYLCQSGVLDDDYSNLVKDEAQDVWQNAELEEAGKAFAELHKAQSASIRNSKKNRKGFRTKALTLSVLPAWSYVAGLLDAHPDRLQHHFTIPKAAKGAPDPMNAEEMSLFKHDQDPATYRGLGTRSSTQDRQRMAQVFLARSLEPDAVLEKKLLNMAVSQVVGLKAMQKGYTA